jgi:hypothetical protein
MTDIVTTTLLINFSEDTEAILTAEVDDRATSEGGFNDGQTRFYPGDNPVLLLFKTTNVAVTMKVPSDGSLSTIGNPIVRRKEQLQFANVKEAKLRYPYVSGFTVLRKSPTIPANPVVSGNSARFPDVRIGIVEVEYNSRAEAIRLNGAVGDLPVLIYFEGLVS